MTGPRPGRGERVSRRDFLFVAAACSGAIVAASAIAPRAMAADKVSQKTRLVPADAEGQSAVRHLSEFSVSGVV